MCDTCATEITALTIALRFAVGAHSYSATSPDWPAHEAEGFTASEAVELLLEQVDGYRPLPVQVVDVLTAAGGRDLVTAWDSLVYAEDVSQLRICPREVQATLDRFGDVGIDPRDVPFWVAARIDIVDAGVAHERGMSPAAYATWRDQFWVICRSVPQWDSADRSFVARDPLNWLRAGISLEYLAVFLEMNVEPVTAGDGWEPLARTTDMPVTRLRHYLQAGMSIAEATTYERRIADGEQLESIIDTLAALTPPRAVVANPDPWATAEHGF